MKWLTWWAENRAINRIACLIQHVPRGYALAVRACNGSIQSIKRWFAGGSRESQAPIQTRRRRRRRHGPYMWKWALTHHMLHMLMRELDHPMTRELPAGRYAKDWTKAEESGSRRHLGMRWNTTASNARRDSPPASCRIISFSILASRNINEKRRSRRVSQRVRSEALLPSGSVGPNNLLAHTQARSTLGTHRHSRKESPTPGLSVQEALENAAKAGLSVSEAFTQIEDLIGAMIVCNNLSDIEPLVEMIRTECSTIAVSETKKDLVSTPARRGTEQSM